MLSVLREIIDVLATVVVGILTALVMSAVFILFMAYKRNKDFYKPYFWNAKKNKNMSDIKLIKPATTAMYNSELNVNKFMMNENLEKFLDDEEWLNDVSDIIPHCLGILKNCRSLTEKLATLCMGILNTNGPAMKQIVDCARQISSRIDDMVSTMYPPLNLQLLEARATALKLAVTQLAIIARYEGGLRKIPMDWMDLALQDIESHISQSILIEELIMPIGLHLIGQEESLEALPRK